MRVCIFGAGATGGHFAIRLARGGHDVSVIARGAQLDAIRRKGLQLRSGDDMLSARVAASDDAKAFGAQDVVLVTTKATALPAVAEGIGPLIGPQTLVVFTQNGMTWWYPLGLPQHCPPPPKLPLFDLADRFLPLMRREQIAGGIVYSANELEAPGLVRNNSPHHNRLEIGAVGANDSAALAAARAMLKESGLLSPDPGDIRAAVWTKLLNNMSGSVLGLVTASTSDSARNDVGLRAIYRRLVREGLTVSAAHGYPLADVLDTERMLARLLHHKASLLQDYEQGRAMEIGEIVLAPLAFARAAGIPTPTLDAIAALAAKLAGDRGLFTTDYSRWPALWQEELEFDPS